MCKILSIEKKTDHKNLTNKKILKKLVLPNVKDTTQCNLNSLGQIFSHTGSKEIICNNHDLYDVQKILLCKREKSRIAAKNRRNQENKNLSELYISLPVATQSKLLCCYDDYFIGNFEKATIIKISAYILNLYNSLSNLLFDNSNEIDRCPLVSLFSQSYFGLFWCEKSTKLVFSSPSLARLTGLYWCNMIGMPHNSIIDETSDQESSNIVFLRFMMGALKDRGIFTVNPQKFGAYKKPDEVKTENVSTYTNQSRQDFIGKLPCSVWCSRKLSNDITFSLIQPLITAPQTIINPSKKIVQTHQPFPYRLPVFNNNFHFGKRSSYKFTSHHCIDSLATFFVSGDLSISLGYAEEDFSKSNLLSFFHLDDVVQVIKQVNELLSGQKRIQMGIARLCTPKVDIYRWGRYILQINNVKDATESGFRSHRSNISHEEAYSQNLMRLSNNLDNIKDNFKKIDDFDNFWLEASFSLCHYFKENQSNFSSNTPNNDLCINTEFVKSNQADTSISKLVDIPNINWKQTFEKDCMNWFDESSQVDISVDLINNHQLYGEKKHVTYYTPVCYEQSSILRKELMRPASNYCA